jgi:hypothetical protein
MATVIFGFTSLNVADGNSLKEINGALVNQDDMALGSYDTRMCLYQLNATSGAAESIPTVVTPSANSGLKRWELKAILAADLMVVGLSALQLVGTDSDKKLVSFSPTNHGILVGSSTAPATSLAVGGTGKLLKGVSAGDPTWSTVALTEGANQFQFENGSASLEVGADSDVQIIGAAVSITDDLSIVQSLEVNGAFGIQLLSYGQKNTLTLNEDLIVGDGYAGTIRFTAASKTLTVHENTTLNGTPSPGGGGDFLVVQVFS